MKTKLLTFLAILLCSLASTGSLMAQERTIRGVVTSADDGLTIPGVTVIVPGTSVGTTTDGDGAFVIKVGTKVSKLQFSFVGMQTKVVVLSSSNSINVVLQSDARQIDQVVVTALGEKVKKRGLGYSTQDVKGNELAQGQRDNFLNSLSGRVAGLEVTSTSGMPGASSSIIIRGASSLSGNNQPLFIVDGLPISNSTFSTGALASSLNSGSDLANRGADFTNRAADINPEDIESMTILKGPEASALYGIQAANGAIVITTKRGKSGAIKMSYSNSFTVSKIREYPKIQQIYGQGASINQPDNTLLTYLGPKYDAGTKLYNNLNNFFQTGFSNRHNFSAEGGSDKLTYRSSVAYSKDEGVVPGTDLQRLNIGLNTIANIATGTTLDVSMNYINTQNNQQFKGSAGPMLNLLQWPSTDDASVYMNDDGTPKRTTISDANRADNPYFNVNKNQINSVVNRFITNVGLKVKLNEWLDFSGNVGSDLGTSEYLVFRHPYSVMALSYGGLIDQSTLVEKLLNIQSYLTASKTIADNFNLKVMAGAADNAIYSKAVSVTGQSLYDKNFVSINNTDPTKMRALSTIYQKRVLGVFGKVSLDYKSMAYVTVTGRNDWSSTLPVNSRSFFYPSFSSSFVFTELPMLKDNPFLSFGKLSFSAAQVGKDAPAYSIAPSLSAQATTGGGFSYGFTGPNPNLKPEKSTSKEIGLELRFFKDRLNIESAYYTGNTKNQIVSNVRMSYGTGSILSTLNGGETEKHGLEIMAEIIPVKTQDLKWSMNINYSFNRNKLKELSANMPEYYLSDTWMYGNVRGGASPGYSVNTLTALSRYQRNNAGDILINPTTGLPVIENASTAWYAVGNREPKFTMGYGNNITYKNFTFSFLFDIRVGGDIFNATEAALQRSGLSVNTLNRENAYVFKGVIKDGLQNTNTPTVNTISIIPARIPYFYSNFVDADFIEKDINWVRLREVTLSYSFPRTMLAKIKPIQDFTAFVTATDVFLLTNYSGLDPVCNGNSAAVGGAGGQGFDYGNFPMPIGINFGIKVNF
ncbi:MAG: SusC/RagA family TonB-linked outer membrane protein [Bacteroidota bacterium]|nr:SusC/RagA family TonB-linked outer membrane protein [Bacteroidota bacterium]MDP4206621.1 SusC/RagA family TonB-linked outer membrane protein [Bacteroidota bacterium]